MNGSISSIRRRFAVPFSPFPSTRHEPLLIPHAIPCSQVRDAIYGAIRMPIAERHIRHDKHWKYVSSHTVQFWAKVRPWA